MDNLTTANHMPIDPTTGLTLPCRTFYGSQELAKHRAMVALEQEILALKFDRFGWDRDKGTPAHNRVVMDWMNALCDFPLSEVQAACRAAVIERPNHMPNEGHIVGQIQEARAVRVAAYQRQLPQHEEPAVKHKTGTEESRKAFADSLLSGAFRFPQINGGE